MMLRCIPSSHVSIINSSGSIVITRRMRGGVELEEEQDEGEEEVLMISSMTGVFPRLGRSQSPWTGRPGSAALPGLRRFSPGTERPVSTFFRSSRVGCRAPKVL